MAVVNLGPSELLPWLECGLDSPSIEMEISWK